MTVDVSRRIWFHPTAVELVLTDRQLGVLVELEYSTADPYAVRLTAVPDTADPEPSLPGAWLVDREILTDGLVRPAGAGAVRAHPSRDRRWVLLDLDFTETEPTDPPHAPHLGTLRYAMSRRSLRDFVRQCRLLVPPGTEHRHLDLDAELQQLYGRTA